MLVGSLIDEMSPAIFDLNAGVSHASIKPTDHDLYQPGDCFT
jgi:hypothetical protein